ncbi:hypothetical protein GCM10023257_70050 [Streptomyces hyderabadensis]|uniref:Uncharacterized protein n=2 Tax=Streptomyces TaxID=1883 RepID=A0ABP9IWF7_9ACTN
MPATLGDRPPTVRTMTKVILMYGPAHGRTLTTEAGEGEVLREAGWSYQLTDDLDDHGRRIAKAYMD